MATDTISSARKPEAIPAPMQSRRTAVIRSWDESPLHLLVIGGGIVGAGIARDAAMRGLRVGLVEQHDFASGTSSRSSRLLHGGMRYLAQGRLGMVREASIEKKTIHHIAPHLAEPLPFIFPTYSGDKEWVLWKLKIGVKIYDLLCGGRNLGKSTWLKRSDALDKVPALCAEGLEGAVRYFDGFTNDSRLVLDTLRSAAKHGAGLLNYCQFKDAGPLKREADNAPLWECKIHDLLADSESTIRAHSVVNASGPWADRLPHSRVKLRITKGVHVVVKRDQIPVPETVVMTEAKRILFAIPWGECTILGTTDTDYRGALEDVRVDPADVDYIFRVTRRFFPEANLKPEHVISAWAGLRPLIADSSGKPSDISRSHKISSPEPGWWDVTGGKLTTYRLMGEQTVNRVVAWLTKRKELNGTISPCRTAQEVLLSPTETQGLSGILPPECSRRAVQYFCANEWAVHLDDVMLRRTSWHFYCAEAARIAESVADWMREVLGWSEASRASELERYRRAVVFSSDPVEKASKL